MRRLLSIAPLLLPLPNLVQAADPVCTLENRVCAENNNSGKCIRYENTFTCVTVNPAGSRCTVDANPTLTGCTLSAPVCSAESGGICLETTTDFVCKSEPSGEGIRIDDTSVTVSYSKETKGEIPAGCIIGAEVCLDDDARDIEVENWEGHFVSANPVCWVTERTILCPSVDGAASCQKLELAGCQKLTDPVCETEEHGVCVRWSSTYRCTRDEIIGDDIITDDVVTTPGDVTEDDSACRKELEDAAARGENCTVNSKVCVKTDPTGVLPCLEYRTTMTCTSSSTDTCGPLKNLSGSGDCMLAAEPECTLTDADGNCRRTESTYVCTESVTSESVSPATFLKAMTVTLKNVNIEDGASFETSLDTNQFTAQTVTVKEGGVFNVTKLNSRFDAKNDQNLAKDQLLIDNNLNLIFDHAQMHVDGKVYTGNLKVGRLSGSIGTVTLKGGEHNFTNLTVGSNGSAFNVEDGAVVTVGSLKLYQGDTSGAKVLVNDSTLVNKGALTIEKDTNAGQLELNNGTFQTAATDFFKKKEAAAAEAAAQPEYVATGNQTFLAGNGTLNLTSKAFEYSLTDLNAAQDLIDTDRNIKVVFTNGTLTLKDGETLDADSISGLNLAGHTGVAGDNGAFAVDKTTTVGAIDFKAVTNKEATEIALGNSAALTLAGNGGDVNVDTLKTEALTVAGDFTARAVEATTAKIDGILTANSVKTTDATDGAKVTGALVLTGNVKKDVSELTGKVTVTDRGVLTTNRAAGLAYAAEYADEDLSVAYVDRQLKLAEGAVINIGEAPATGALAAAATTVNVNANGIYGIDAASFLYTGKPAAEADLSVFGNSTALNLNGGEVEILNITKLGQIDLGGAITNTANIDTDSIYVVVNDKDVDAATGVVTLSYNDGLVADKTVDARLKDAFTKGVGAKEMAILSALDTPAFFNDKTGKFTADGNKALEQATGGNATAGVLNVAYDANAQVTDAIVRHQLSEHAGMGVWADVFYAKNEAKEIYGDFGYSADIYGGVLGFDYTAACGGTLGAALTVGTADADSEGGVLSTSLSSDFVGLSVYASKDFSGLNVKADLGYIDFSNDFTGLGDASDATTITFGVRGDFTAYQNGAFSVVPHMGLRYTRIDTDAVAFNDEQNMNVLEAPIGVKFAGTFEATGWKLVPSYDFTIVPQLGDKEVEAFGTAGDITILSGGLFNNVLGVEAVKDNMSFGLNASYGFGPDDRANTQVNANFRYHF